MIAAKRVLVWSGLFVLVLAGLYLGLRSWSGEHEEAGAPKAAPVIALSVPALPGNGEFPNFAPPSVFRVRQGQEVSLVIKSASPGQVHLHGYEKMIDLVQGGTVTLKFRAGLVGRFPVHYHDPDEVMYHLATIEVLPK